MARAPLSAIVGLGFSPLSREPAGSVRALAAAAVRAAMADAGVDQEQVDGLLLNPSALADPGVLPPRYRTTWACAHWGC